MSKQHGNHIIPEQSSGPIDKNSHIGSGYYGKSRVARGRDESGMKTSFEEGFQRLTGFSHTPWQSRLFKRSVANDLPNAKRNFMLLDRKKWGVG